MKLIVAILQFYFLCQSNYIYIYIYIYKAICRNRINIALLEVKAGTKNDLENTDYSIAPLDS